MKKQLQFDAGNTRLKWRYLINKETAQSGFIENKADWSSEIPDRLSKLGEIDVIAVSSVSGGERLKKLVNIIKEVSNVQLVTAATKKSFAGVDVVYDKPEKLGVDRWLAMLAAHQKMPKATKVIVDCGTAITLDVVDQNGQHLGGYIVPGLHLMKGALAMNTADLKKVEHLTELTALGTDTESCINQGVLMMAVALVSNTYKQYPESVLFMTGGDAPLLMRHLSSLVPAVIEAPELVMDGLTVFAQ